MTVIDYSARVEKGVALLDKVVPDWFTRIDTDRLDIANGYLCVTAQVADDSWRVGMTMLGLEWDSYIEHGFHVRSSDHESEGEADRMFDLLNDYWYAEITKRQERADG